MKIPYVRNILFLFGMAIVAALLVSLSCSPRPPLTRYPDQEWPTSTPEEQGLDSAKLAEGLLSIKKKDTPIHSLMMIRHGSVILDAKFYPYDGSTYHDVASVTKSVMTTLIGIAADQGKLDLDQPMVSFFPNRPIANRDERKERITVRHLVSNSSGLDCIGEGGEPTQAEMAATDDWVQFILDRKAVYEPGTHFAYCSPGMHLLSAILQEATGQTALEFARANLFGPLGITNVFWPIDPQGYNRGHGDLSLFPQDMARLGYLFLHEGRWEDRQIVSREWVQQATRQQITPVGDDEGYGYGWWVSLPDEETQYFQAEGREGQRILVVPSLDVVIVTTGGGFEFDDIEPYIGAAIGDLKRPLPANPDGVARLQAAVAEVAQPPAAQPAPALPQIASAISGKTFTFGPNLLKLRAVRLTFETPGEATYRMDLGNESEPRQVGVGLDGRYRPGQAGRPAIARGQWLDDQTFAIEYSEGPGLNSFKFLLRFADDRLYFTYSNATTGQEYTTTGAPQE